MSGGAVDLSHILARGQAPNGSAVQPAQPAATGTPAGQGGGQVIDVPSIVLQITDDTFEQLMQLSQVVPVVVVLGADNCAPCDEVETQLTALTKGLAGKTLLATVNAQHNPGLAQAFQVQQFPTVVAVISGQAIPMFQGVQPEAQVKELYGQLLTVAAQQGVTGTVSAPDLGETDEPQEPEVNPEHLPGIEAMERGDYPAAITAYEQVLARAPRDAEAQAALAQARLLNRLSGVSVSDVREQAAASPADIDAQMLVADLDLSGGHIEDAFLRLLDLFRDADSENRNVVRERLLELFEVVGLTDPRVNSARAQLTNLLFS